MPGIKVLLFFCAGYTWFCNLAISIVSGAANGSTSGAPKLREDTPSYLEVILGEKVKLRCPVSGYPKPFIEWYKNNETLILNSGSYKVIRNSLNIENVQDSDADTYHCKASNEYGVLWKNFTIKVIDPSMFDEPQADDSSVRVRALVRSGEKTAAPYFHQMQKMDVKLVARPAGSSVTLLCPAGGHPVPNIKWLKNGQVPRRELDKDIIYKKWSITIKQLATSDSGKYTCILTNSEGSISWTFKLEVTERVPHKPIFQDGYPSNQTVYVGQQAKFECRFISDLQPRLRWLRHYEVNGSYSDDAEMPYVEPLESTDPNSTDPHFLILDNVTFSDEGYYTCLAGNSLGVSYRSAYLKVISTSSEEKEKVLETDESVSDSKFKFVYVWMILILISLSGGAAITFAVYRFKKRKLKRLAHYPVVIRKRIILERQNQKDESSQTPIVPTVKIDYERALVSELNPTQMSEYELPEDPEYEFPRSRLLLGMLLGEGAFGRVFKGEAFGLKETEGSSVVAVKMLKDGHTDQEMADFISEMELMKVIGKHMNVISLLGCCTQGGPLYMIVEYARYGNLRDFLRSHRPASGYEQPMGSRMRTQTLTHECLISFAYQIARGMNHLASKKCVHRDLAARNILVAEDNIIKIADFGLARDIHYNDYYKKKTNGRLPVKWMAPEALCDRVFTVKSDVWSYGIVLWEIESLGGTPYPSVPTENLYKVLKSGHRMHKPAHCPQDIYLLMHSCWMDSPENRPLFDEILLCLDRVMMQATNREYLELNISVMETPDNSGTELWSDY